MEVVVGEAAMEVDAEGVEMEAGAANALVSLRGYSVCDACQGQNRSLL
jgi:hypothetical protein